MSLKLPWIILFSPLLAALAILLATRRYRQLSAYLSVAAVVIAFTGSCLLFAGPDRHLQFTWLDFAPRLVVNFGATINALSKTMLIVVTTVGLLVHVYSLGYMRDDHDIARYFAGLSMFMFSMLGIVLADNFVMTFIFWELVGLSSYLLIGHWYDRPQAADAANKAFLANRIGDFGFMLGILMLWGLTGTVNFAEIQSFLTSHQAKGIGDMLPYLTAASLLVFCGPLGKSAQVPLHVWLPDAMEGPTPVSALIHAATMVAAGVYLLVKISFLLALVPFTREVIAWVGIITSVLAALMATQQNDIKRILAYSTLSQLGYMVSAVGVTAGEAAMFHLFTHAFFKALLFLGAGAVIYGVHHEQNIWKMGGLRTRMPVTFWTFLLASLALMGCPFLSGYYSKDLIIEALASQSAVLGSLGLFVALLTAFYMMRLIMVVFINRPSSKEIEHAHEVPAVMALPLLVLAVPAISAGWPFVRGLFFPTLAHAREVISPGGRTLLSSVPALAIGAFIAGALLGFVIYRGKSSEPIKITLFRRKFFFDEFYAALIRLTQDGTARLSALFDRWVIDGAGVRGISGATWGGGFLLRFLQVGNLQAYAFFFGLGVLLLVYLAIS